MKIIAIILLYLCGAHANKIIGGSNASSGQFPSIVFQTKSGTFFCGGTIIAANRVLTAAHCQQSLYDWKVTGGTNSRISGGTSISVSGNVVHTEYNSANSENDIMILILASSFTLGGTINVAQLADSSPCAGSGITIAGWGDTHAGLEEIFPDDLQYANVAVISTTECNSQISYNGAILSGMICIGQMTGGKDPCQGDSGGPAYIQGETIVAGISSWGEGCGQQNKPGVYTDVAHYRTWINSNM